MRITENLLVHSFLSRTANVLSRMALAQAQITTGKKIQKPSDDPSILSKSLDVRSDLRQVQAYAENASAATVWMSVTESALSEISNVLSGAKELLIEAANGTTDGTGADSIARELRSMVETLLLVANRDIGGRRVFSGQETRTSPYAEANEGYRYAGDFGDILEELGPGFRVAINLAGPAAFETVPGMIAGGVDLEPAASTTTRLADLLGGSGVSGGHVRVTDSNGASADIDLSGAENLGQVIDGINAAGLDVTAALSADRKSIELTDTGGGPDPLVVEDLFEGSLASGLGIATSSDAGQITGADLDPALTEDTPTALLFGGAGLGAGGWQIGNRGEDFEREATIDPAQANTVGDLLDLVNDARTPGGEPLEIRARLTSSGITIESTKLHTTLSVSDVGGGTSAQSVGLAGVGEPTNVFGLLENAARDVGSRDQDGMDRAIAALTSAIEQTAGIRGSYGARARQVITLGQSLENNSIDLMLRLSDVEDADIARAAIELTQAETVYNAALGSGARLLSRNLFDFIR